MKKKRNSFHVSSLLFLPPHLFSLTRLTCLVVVFKFNDFVIGNSKIMFVLLPLIVKDVTKNRKRRNKTEEIGGKITQKIKVFFFHIVAFFDSPPSLLKIEIIFSPFPLSLVSPQNIQSPKL
jgi:hypothetical protein